MPKPVYRMYHTHYNLRRGRDEPLFVLVEGRYCDECRRDGRDGGQVEKLKTKIKRTVAEMANGKSVKMDEGQFELMVTGVARWMRDYFKSCQTETVAQEAEGGKADGGGKWGKAVEFNPETFPETEPTVEPTDDDHVAAMAVMSGKVMQVRYNYAMKVFRETGDTGKLDAARAAVRGTGVAIQLAPDDPIYAGQLGTSTRVSVPAENAGDFTPKRKRARTRTTPPPVVRAPRAPRAAAKKGKRK